MMMTDPGHAPLSFGAFLTAPFKDISFDKAGGFIRDNFFFLLWILFVPLFLFGMKQGWELLYGLFDDPGPYPGFRAASMLFVYFLQALAIWLLPLPVFRNMSREAFDRLRPVTGQNPYRGLLVSSLPMILYSVAMIAVQAKRSFVWWQVSLMAATIAGGLYFMYWIMERSRLKIGQVQFLMGMNWLLVFVLIWIGKFLHEVFWNYYFVGLCVTIQMALLGGLIRRLEHGYVNGSWKTHRRYYRFVFITVIASTLILSFMDNLQYLTPPFVLLLIITCYVLLNDLVIALYILKKGKWLKIGLSIALVALGWFILLRRSEIHNINYVSSTLKADDRVDFHRYFEAWYHNNIAPRIDTTRDEDIPIFLVAAQGGGSRAGMWTSHILNCLEKESGGRFHRRLFAVTSASGGSTGTGATLAFWRYLEDHPEIDSSDRAQLFRYFAPEMFRRNYLSSQFMQLFVNEVGKRFVALFKDDVYDRNYEHQRHEASGFANAIGFAYNPSRMGELDPLERIKNTFRNDNFDSLGIGDGRSRIPNYPMLPYLSYWYGANKTPDTRFPLYFPVTTNIQTGKSGYASAIAWDSTLFIDAIDILADAERGRDAHGRSLAMVTTSNLSQLFPIMNSYTYIEGAGNFMDGGLFENMGLTLMNRIHTRLKEEIESADYIPDAVKKRLRIKLLFFINGAIEPREETTFNPKNQSIATFTAVGFSSIYGTTTWWLDYFRKTMPADAQPVELILQRPTDPDRDKVPLGRWLSIRSADTVVARVERLPLNDLLGPLR